MYEDYTSWAERNGFAHWAMAIIWIIIAFVGFQVIAAIIFFVLLAVTNLSSAGSIGNVTNVLSQNFDLLFIGNSAGQILFLALATWGFCRLQVTKKKRPAFLRFSKHSNTFLYAVIALLVILGIQPFVWFLGWVNTFLPLPELFGSLQLQQMSMLQTYLTGDNFLLLVLFHVAVIPAICEEVLFRGYVLRSFQKSWGVVAAIIVSGLIFGMFHLRLTHLLPLATIGMLLGYLTWVSESIIPAILAHFLNNAGSVFLVKYYPESDITNVTGAIMPPLWLVAISVAITAYFLYFLYDNRVQTDPLLNKAQTQDMM